MRAATQAEYTLANSYHSIRLSRRAQRVRGSSLQLPER